MDQAVRCALVQTDMDFGNDVVDCSCDNDHAMNHDVHHLLQPYRRHAVDDDHVIGDDQHDGDHGLLDPVVNRVKSFLNLAVDHCVG